MLQIDFDTNDAIVTTPGLSLIDPVRSFSSAIQASGQLSPYLLSPSSSALMLRPIQLTPNWPGATKFRSADYGAPNGWEEQQVRATDDWFMHATGNINPLSLSYWFPPNTGWFVEFRAYADPKPVPGPIFDFAFGANFLIVVSSDGRMDLYDQRTASDTPVGSGNIANFNSFVNQDVSLMILPYRGTQILVWSPNRGGYIDVTVSVGNDGNITEACAPAVYRSIQPPSALVAITPLLYPAAGQPSIAAPEKRLTTPLTQTPSFTSSVYDQPGLSSLTFQTSTPYTPGPPIDSFLYSVTMAGNTSNQTAEEQGVVGIGVPTETASGDSVFSGVSAIYSLTTPFLYLTVINYPRTLGVNSGSLSTLTGILSAKLRVSKDRAAKTFEFVVDNPANITGTGVNYTNLRNLQNRRCLVYLTNPSLEADAGHTAIAVDPDPDTPLIVAYGCRRVYIFDGFSDQPEFVDGVESRVSIRCLGLRKRLRSYLFTDQPHYDGMSVNDVVTDVLTRAGFVGPADTAATGLGLEIVCEESAQLLPAATPGDEPLFTPSIGTNAEEFLTLLSNYTGWELDDLIGVGESNAAWYWVPSGYYASSVYASQGSPVVGLSSTYVSGLSAGSISIPDAVEPNRGLGSLTMLGDPPPRQSLEEPIANDITVFGADDSGQIIVAHARDENSISNSSAPNYLSGEVRAYILISQWINSQETANQVCAVLYSNLTQARTHLEFVLPDYYPQLGLSAPVTISGYWNGAIDGYEADLSHLRIRKTAISVLRDTS